MQCGVRGTYKVMQHNICIEAYVHVSCVSHGQTSGAQSLDERSRDGCLLLASVFTPSIEGCECSGRADGINLYNIPPPFVRPVAACRAVDRPR